MTTSRLFQPMNLVATRVATQSWLDSSAHHHRFDPPPPIQYQQQLSYQCIPRNSFLRRPTHTEVNWRPPQTYLHYQELYGGIYEFLREPPNPAHRFDAIEYLMSLQRSRTEYQLIPSERRLQEHRICWVLEWLKAMQVSDDDSECSDADTAEFVW